MPAREDTDSICLTIVTTIAEKEDVDPLELDPLHSALDSDALRKLLDGNFNPDLRVQFQYHGYEVTARGDGQVNAERLT